MKLIVYLALFFSMLFWGASFVLTKIALTQLMPVTIIVIRLLISVIILLLYGWFKGILIKINRQNIKFLLIISLFQPFLYFLCENYGLFYTSSTVASVIIATIPLFTPIGAMLILKEKTSMFTWIGLLISLPGVLLVIMKKDAIYDLSYKGIFILLGAVLSAILYGILITKQDNKFNIFSTITYQNIIGLFYFIPVLLFTQPLEQLTFSLSTEVYMSLILLAVFASSLAFLFFIYGIKKIGISKTNAFTNIIPVITAIIAWGYLGDELTLNNWIGIFVVICGLFIAQIKSLKFGIRYRR